MINKILLIAFLLSVFGTGYFYFTSQSDGEQKTGDSAGETGVQVYRNEEWGFQFEYPDDWEVRSPAFGSSVSLFNLAIEPRENFQIRAVTLNITPKAWIEEALIKINNRGVEIKEINLFGLPAIKIQDTNMGRESISFLVLIKDEYWIDITGLANHEETLNQILNSFEFVEPTIEN